MERVGADAVKLFQVSDESGDMSTEEVAPLNGGGLTADLLEVGPGFSLGFDLALIGLGLGSVLIGCWFGQVLIGCRMGLVSIGPWLSLDGLLVRSWFGVLVWSWLGLVWSWFWS